MVLEEIGRGGMGVVWTAYDPKLDRKVAIKLLKASARPSVRQQRFILEAQSLAQLSHPNIVTVHDVDTHDGRLYMAMEYVPGQTLEDWLLGNRSWQEIVDVLIEAGQGLAAAHEAGITHRDFKPSNVLISGEGRVKVLDFGLAKHMHPRGSRDGEDDDSRPISLDVVSDADGRSKGRDSGIMEMIGKSNRANLTKIGRFVGTPAYMAPEQFSMIDPHEVGAWTDQFGFAVTLYEALYGQLPFEGHDLYESYENIRFGRIREPRDSSVPSWIFRVVHRALQYEPDDRFSSMGMLLEALRADPARRRRRLLGYAGGAGLLGLAVFGLYKAFVDGQMVPCQVAKSEIEMVWNETVRAEVHQGLSASDRPFAADTAERVTVSLDHYTDAWVEQHTAICEATQIHGTQSEQLLDARMSCLHRRRGELGALAKVLATPQEETVEVAVAATAELRRPEPCASVQPGAENERPSDPGQLEEFERIQAQLDEANALLLAGRHAGAREVAADAGYGAELAGFRRLLAEALVVEGTAYRRMNELEKARERLRRGINIATEVGDARTEFGGWNDLLYIAGVKLNETQRAEDWQFAAENALLRVGAPQDLAFKLALTTGGVFLEQRRLEEALEFEEDARKLALPDSLQHAKALTNLGIIAGKQENWVLAERRLRESYQVKRRVLGPNHPELASNALNLANVLVQRAEEHDDPRAADAAYDEAEGLYAGVVSFRDKNKTPKDNAQSLIMLGQLQIKRSKLNDARVTYEQALSILRTLPGVDGDVANALFNLGTVERLEGDFSKAEEHYEEAMGLHRSNYGENHETIGTVSLHLCQLFIDAGRYREAIVKCEQALEIFEEDTDQAARSAQMSAYRLLSKANALAGNNRLAAEYEARAKALQEEIDAGRQP
ncbi:MAG: serine/threonine-protein kinase [Myxococcota bacterium]